MSTAQQSRAEPDTITDDLCCAACGYSLRTLSVSAICPECARPVRRSLIPPDLQFVSQRAIRRTRLGIAFWVAGLAMPAVAVIPFSLAIWISPAFWEDLSNRQGLFRQIYWASVYAWSYSGWVAPFVSAVGIVLITVSFVKRPHRFRPRLGILTATLAGAVIASALIQFYLALPGTIPTAPHATRVVIGLIGGVAGSLTMPLCWILLISRLVVNKSHALQIAMRWALVVTMLLMTATLAQFVLYAYAFDHYTWLPLGVFFLAGDQSEWLESALRISRLWGKYGTSGCSILMILALWAYVRRLNSALRSDVMDSHFEARNAPRGT